MSENNTTDKIHRSQNQAPNLPRSATESETNSFCDSTAIIDEPVMFRGPMDLVGPYQIVRQLGRGAMGEVYHAIHTKLQRPVALKILPPDMAQSPRRMQRFQREMAAIGRLDHPNIVLATDAGEANGVYYIAMQLVRGDDLDAILEQHGKMNWSQACELIRQTALGLQHISEQGLVHRDIKPSNIMVDANGNAKILDLGIAMLRDLNEGDTCMTMAGAMMGTPDYIAPEQINRCADVDIRADIYSLGCTLYRMLCGNPPFDGPGYTEFTEKLLGHAAQNPPPLEELCPEIPNGIVELVKQMMAKDPDLRPASPIEVAERLAEFADLPRRMKKSDTEVKTPTLPATSFKKYLIAGGMGMLVVVAFVFAWSSWNETNAVTVPAANRFAEVVDSTAKTNLPNEQNQLSPIASTSTNETLKKSNSETKLPPRKTKARRPEPDDPFGVMNASSDPVSAEHSVSLTPTQEAPKRQSKSTFKRLNKSRASTRKREPDDPFGITPSPASSSKEEPSPDDPFGITSNVTPKPESVEDPF